MGDVTQTQTPPEKTVAAGTIEPSLLQDICYKVTGCAITVLNTIGPGLDPKIYENCLMIELAKQGLRFEYQRKVDVVYSNQRVGVVTLGLSVNDLLLVDVRSVASFNETDFSENICYLKLTHLPMVLMLNFKSSKLQWKKITYNPNR
ncbi:MAG: GxxExxY protein [Puniceicoccales bacterium]|jgi:GxxExxY protein|nr:GxxExxY protein [Puniceicoccales bacterium]